MKVATQPSGTPVCRPLPAHLVQHQVDHHACHRDVEPDGQSPPGDFLVLRESAAKCSYHGNACEYGHRSGKQGMTDQNCEINDPCRPGAWEMYRADMRVIGQVRSQ